MPGRSVTADQIDLIRRLIAEHPTSSRHRLSEKLREAWQWKHANAAPRDMVCRSLFTDAALCGRDRVAPIRYIRFSDIRPLLLEEVHVGWSAEGAAAQHSLRRLQHAFLILP